MVVFIYPEYTFFGVDFHYSKASSLRFSMILPKKLKCLRPWYEMAVELAPVGPGVSVGAVD